MGSCEKHQVETNVTCIVEHVVHSLLYRVAIIVYVTVAATAAGEIARDSFTSQIICVYLVFHMILYTIQL